MDCNKYEQFELGKLKEEKFKKHLIDCSSCRKSKDEDDFILLESKKLKFSIDAPDLWNRIKKDMQKENPQKKQIIPLNRFLFLSFPVKIAASFLIIVILGAYFTFFNTSESTSLLNENALIKVQNIENEYMVAISELEKSAFPKIQKLNIELSLKYKDRLQIIDEQIQLCKEELRLNPINTHIRRYLMEALKDKKNTLLAMNKL